MRRTSPFAAPAVSTAADPALTSMLAVRARVKPTHARR